MLITEIIPNKQTNPRAKCLLDSDAYKFQLNVDPDECNLGASGIPDVAIHYITIPCCVTVYIEDNQTTSRRMDVLKASRELLN